MTQDFLIGSEIWDKSFSSEFNLPLTIAATLIGQSDLI
jgi:hypothetical protein